MTRIHPTAIIEKGAIIGEDCEIGPYCHIGPEVILGDRNVLISSVVIMGKSEIGNENRIFSYAVIGTDPQDLKYRG
ncbi:MAG TPA: acyl-[acyl-carrier-protein]--UDP-N-acetylglucosamine O-acyltransferase, partial [Candidatus Syntrophosphaera thermopropionivorans]|nr:acyl-[acyl-carrier-protein]--UDP-N-acetylglucosamine O-acyltransferase [Candidatus Syntrophosphaera thermopropionivorans]